MATELPVISKGKYCILSRPLGRLWPGSWRACYRTSADIASAEHGIANFTYEFPPGTEIVDETGKEDTIHYPMPTASVQDPLNWTRTWKVRQTSSNRPCNILTSF